MPWPFCDVCQSGVAISVNCSAVGAMSNAYCQECHQTLAEPEFAFHYLYDCVADGNIEAIHPAYHDLKTFKDNRYWTLEEWFLWRHTQWFTPDPMFHWWAFKPHGPLEPPPEPVYESPTFDDFDFKDTEDASNHA